MADIQLVRKSVFDNVIGDITLLKTFDKSNIVNAINSQFSIYTFYVDSVNGDDNNNGSSSAPFATIKKACDSVPIGGYGAIYLAGGQTFTIDENIPLYSKLIRIIGNDTTPPIIKNASSSLCE